MQVLRLMAGPAPPARCLRYWRMTWAPNQAAATPKITSQLPAPNGFSRGTSIPAMATPMNACVPSRS